MYLELTDFDTQERLYLNPDSIVLIQRLPAIEGIDARTKLLLTSGNTSEILLVVETPSVVLARISELKDIYVDE
jgi:hypothetical protein